jgi:hypothetical protein
MTDSLICTACSSTKLEAIVEGGSYVLRCAQCGEGIVATSFIAMHEVEGEFMAYHDPGHGNQPSLGAWIMTGELKEVHQAISSVTRAGSSVLLVVAQPGIAAAGFAPR